MNTISKLRAYLYAGYTAVHVLTHEERRFMLELASIRDDMPDITVHEWDFQRGLVFKYGVTPVAHPHTPTAVNGPSTATSTGLLEYLQNYKKGAGEDPATRAEGGMNIFVLKDFHLHFDKVLNIRLLRNAWNDMKKRQNMIVFLGHTFNLPAELQKEVQLLDYTLPDATGLGERLQFIKGSVDDSRTQDKQPLIELAQEIKEAAVEAARGMTSVEAENAFALAITTAGAFNDSFVKQVFDEKIAQLKKGGVLTYIPTDVSFDNVGGLEGVKKWIGLRKKAYSKAATDYKLPLPKGLLIASVPGSGKSLIAKAIAAELDCPLFLWDIGAMFGSLVGDSEKNLREAIKTIESIGKCVLLLDELDKSLNVNAVSGAGDSGVSSRMFGSLLTWLNDRRNAAFIVATTNDHTRLPSALTRKGRFDQLFWVDLPTAEERREILSVVIKKFGRIPDNYALKSLAAQSENFTGSELDQVFQDAMFAAFKDDVEVTDSHIQDVIADFIPFAVSHSEDLERMRSQAQGKLVMVTSTGDPIAVAEANFRKLSVGLK